MALLYAVMTTVPKTGEICLCCSTAACCVGCPALHAHAVFAVCPVIMITFPVLLQSVLNRTKLDSHMLDYGYLCPWTVTAISILARIVVGAPRILQVDTSMAKAWCNQDAAYKSHFFGIIYLTL